MNCPNCNKPISPEDKFCGNCGYDLKIKENIIDNVPQKEDSKAQSPNNFNLKECPHFGDSIASEDKFCSMCGYKLVNTEESESMTWREKIAFLIAIAPLVLYVVFLILHLIRLF